MASIDISSKLGRKRNFIKLAEGKEYEVDNSADTYLIVQEKIQNQDFSIKNMYDMIEILMGKKALQDIKDMKLSVDGLTAIIIAISAIVNEVGYEEMEKRFQSNK